LTPGQIPAARELAATLTARALEHHTAADAARRELDEIDGLATAAVWEAWQAGRPPPADAALGRRRDDLLARVRGSSAEGNACADRAAFLSACADRAEAAASGKHSPRHAGSRLSGVRITPRGGHR
jgi:hypothetical protein